MGKLKLETLILFFFSEEVEEQQNEEVPEDPEIKPEEISPEVEEEPVRKFLLKHFSHLKKFF